MSSSTAQPAAAGAVIDRLRARLKRLASDPRAGLIPEGRAIAIELLAFLDDCDASTATIAALLARIDATERRLTLLENAFALTAQHGGQNCDD